MKLSELRGHQRVIQRFINRRPDRDRVWQVIERHWLALAEWAAGELREMTTRAHRRQSRIALESIRNVAETAEPREVVLTLIAFCKLWHEKPSRFRSDRAARFEAARVLRRMTDAHVGMWRNDATGKTHRVYQDVSPRVLDDLGGIIFRTMLPVALNVVRQMETEEEAERERVRDLYRILGKASAPAKQASGVSGQPASRAPAGPLAENP